LDKLDLVVVGELNVDLILQDLSAFPEIGKEKIAQDMRLTLGSASAILAANAARLGTRVGFIGKLGSDPFGEIVLKALKERGVDCSGIQQDATSRTGVTVSMTFPSDYAMVTYMGAMETFTIRDVDFDYLENGRHMHLSSYYLQPGLREGCPTLFARAKRAKITTSLDPGWDPDEAWGRDILNVLEHVDVLLPNGREAMSISGRSTPESALNELSRYCAFVVIKLGEQGSLCCTNGETLRINAYDVTPLDTTGAGDSFNAGFLHEWLNGSDIKHCLQVASACGALATMKMGGITAFPTIEELNTFLNEHPEDIFNS